VALLVMQIDKSNNYVKTTLMKKAKKLNRLILKRMSLVKTTAQNDETEVNCTGTLALRYR
jgi:hypothetical protein